MGWLQFDATIHEAENLLKTKYHVYSHDTTGQAHVACEEYSIPSHLQQHVDFVYPTLHFDRKLLGERSDNDNLDKREVESGVAKSVGSPTSPSIPKHGPSKPWQSIVSQLENCDEQIVPNCLRLLYEFPPNEKEAAPGNSYGIVEYTPQAYVPSDLDLFFGNFSPRAVGTRPILDSIDGGIVQQTNMSFNFNGESDLDLEYGMSLVVPQKVTLYQTGDDVEGASFNNFLDAIDVSFCFLRPPS